MQDPMPTSGERRRVERSFDERAYLRRLAASLIGESDADDLVQDALVAAAVQPGEGKPARAWLRRVLRNRAVSLRRSRSSRHLREQTVASFRVPGASPEQRVLEHRLVTELEAMPAEDRELLRARFWDGCTPLECARRLGRPASTVRTQLSRALARLRRRLDSDFGGRAAWLSVLPPPVHARSVESVGAGSWLAVLGLLATVGGFTVYGCSASDEASAPPDEALHRSASVAAEQPAETATRANPIPDHAAHSASASRRGTASRSPGRPGPKGIWKNGRLPHPKLAAHFAYREIRDDIAACHTGSDDAQASVEMGFLFEDDGSGVIETVTLDYHEGLDADELECIEQTLLSMEVPPSDPVPGTAYPTRFAPTHEFYFGSDGTMEEHSARRGPMMDLLSRKKLGTDVDDAILGCLAEAGAREPVEVSLEFEPISGELARVEPSDTSVGRCLEAVLPKLLYPVPFEPEEPEDAHLNCTLAESDGQLSQQCRRLGPNGRYVAHDPQ